MGRVRVEHLGPRHDAAKPRGRLKDFRERHAFLRAANPRPMAERHRGPEEPEVCSVSGCKREGERSVSSKKFQGALPGVELKGEVGRRIHLCREHYRDYRKKTKEERELDRLGW